MEHMKTRPLGKKSDPTPAALVFRGKPPRNRRRSNKPVPLTRGELQDWIEQAKSLPDVRWDKVQAVREALAADTYDVDARLAELSEKFPGTFLEYLGRPGSQ
jgi:hypothetical protein